MIARFLYRNPRILLLFLLVVMVAGGSSFFLMPRLEDPVLGKRVAVVSTIFPGTDSERVESLVTIPLERQLQGIAGIKEVRSNSLSAISNVVIELEDHVEQVEPVWSAVRTRVRNAERLLPEACLEPEFEVFSLKAYAAIVALQWHEPANPNSLILHKLTAKLRSRIGNLDGTESVDLFGDPGEEYLVEVEPEVLSSLQMSTAAIAGQIASTFTTQSAGTLQGTENRLLVDFGKYQREEQSLEDAIVRFGPPAGSAKLSDIAKITRTAITPRRDVALVDGQEAFVLGAFVDDRIRLDHWWEDCKTLIDQFQQEYQAEVVVDVLFSQHEYIDARMHVLLRNLFIGALAVTLVVLLLMGWRSMILVGVTLPLTCLLVLSGMHFLEIPLHQMSVTGLIVALGLLIDNAIVIVEDVRSRIAGGDSTESALLKGVRHLRMPLFASTITTTLAFMPIATLPGPPGEFVGTIAMSVILAISASFLLAMTVVPALLGLLQVASKQRGLLAYGFSSTLLTRIYQASLLFVFRYPIVGILLGSTLPALGYLVATDLPEQFFPACDRNQIQIEVELPARESIEKTLAMVKTVDQSVRQHELVDRAHWFVGRSAPTFYYNVVPRRRGTPYYAQAIVELFDTDSIERTVQSLQETLDAQHAACRVVVRQLEQGPPFDAPLEIRVTGPDLQILQQLGSQIRQILSQTSDVLHTRSDLQETVPKLVLDIDERGLSDAGLNKRDLGRLLYTTLEGAPAGSLRHGEDELPIRVRMAPDQNNMLTHLAALQVPSFTPRPPSGPPSSSPPSSPTLLGTISDFQLGSDLAAVVRINGNRTNEVKAYITAGVLPSQVLEAFHQRLQDSEFRLPQGYAISFAGEQAERSRAVHSLVARAVLLFALMILTLVVSFRSFRCTLIILTVGGLAIGLGPFALWTYGFPFGFMAIVGTMGLVGVAINDSIVVLAALRENHSPDGQAPQVMTDVVTGCTRHVLTTTLTTIVGFLPLILAGGRFWPPLAITIAGGVGGATFLALYFVPSLSLLLRLNQMQE